MNMDQLVHQRNRVVSETTSDSNILPTSMDPHSELSRTTSKFKMQHRKLLSHIPRVLRLAAYFTAVMFFMAFLLSFSPISNKLNMSESWTTNKEFDVPYLLNVTAFLDDKKIAPASALTTAAEADEDSVAAAYVRLPHRCPTRPTASDLQATLRSIATEPEKNSAKRRRAKAIKLAEQNDTLTVQLEPNGFEANGAIIKHIQKRAVGFQHVLLVPPPRKPMTMASVFQRHAVRCLTKTAAQVAREAGAYVEVFQGGPGMPGADDDALVLHAASNLVVHGGSRGALAALATGGNAELGWKKGLKEFLDVDLFRWAVPNLIGANTRANGEYLALNGMGKVSESCCEFELFGTGDGSKVVCSNARDFAREPCWVLSLGCGNKWSFETDIVRRTKCFVQVYDCTKDYTVPRELEERVTLHKLCIGRSSDEGGARANYRSWSDILAIGASASGLPEDTMPTLAKIDVEGWELPAFLDITREEAMMPEQIVVELHASTNVDVGHPYEERVFSSGRYGVRRETYAELFANLSNAGYELVHRADNPFCGHCSEVTLMRRHVMPQPE